MELTVKNLKQDVVVINVQPSQTVNEVRKVVADKFSMVEHGLKLVYGDKVLTNGDVKVEDAFKGKFILVAVGKTVKKATPPPKAPQQSSESSDPTVVSFPKVSAPPQPKTIAPENRKTVISPKPPTPQPITTTTATPIATNSSMSLPPRTIVAAVRSLLATDKVDLTSPTYTTSSSAMETLAVNYGRILSQPSTTVSPSLPELSHWGYGSPRWYTAIKAALVEIQLSPKQNSKYENDRQSTQCAETDAMLTIEGYLIGGVEENSNTKQTISCTVAASTLGRDLIAQFCQKAAVQHLQVIASGRTLQSDATLAAQGWTENTSASQPVRALLVARDEAHKLSDPVAQVITAAQLLTKDGYGDFELSDANTGRLVPIATKARSSLIAAIALHAKGRELLSNSEITEALPFLVEADAAFARCRRAGAGVLLDKLDNYAHLQLDICWAYAVSSNPEYLDDAEQRLEVAHRVLILKLDANFLGMAEEHARRGKVLPPSTVQVTRFWLLRGIARRFRNPQSPEAQHDLDKAHLFCQQLRIAQQHIDALVMIGATVKQATAALRRAEGHPDKAAEQFLVAEQQRKAARRQRQAQLKYGSTKNGSHVDVDMLSQLTMMGLKKEVALAALKQTNNDLNAALDAAVTLGDSLLGDPRGKKRHKTKGTKRKRQQEETAAVDEIALVTLLSIVADAGFGQEACEKALRKTSGNVDEAVVALQSNMFQDSHHEDNHEDNADEDDMDDDDDDDDSDDDDEEDTSKPKSAATIAYEEARDIIERELGGSLRRSDLDDEIGGSSMAEETLLLQQHGYSF